MNNQEEMKKDELNAAPETAETALRLPSLCAVCFSI